MLNGISSQETAVPGPLYKLGNREERNLQGRKSNHFLQISSNVSLTAEPRVREENEVMHEAEPQFFSLVCTRVSINMFVRVRPGVKHNLPLKAPKHHNRRKQDGSQIDTNSIK